MGISKSRIILLTGAGFSRNWGGWTADEAFEYLLGNTGVDDLLRKRLWENRRGGHGFEDLLTELQKEYEIKPYGQPEQTLRAMTNAVRSMFAEMAYGYSQLNLERPATSLDMSIGNFLRHFNAIYTLNQDTLIEQKYSSRNVLGDFLSGYLPGVRQTKTELEIEGRRYQTYEPVNPPYSLEDKPQPYVKLHGSFNWFRNGAEDMLIMGGNKAADIEKHPLLNWYQKLFSDDLRTPNCRLMVIGYSFRDSHINKAIQSGIANGLKIFIIDTRGADVLSQEGSGIQPAVLGASRRPLLDTFSFDRVEHEKVMRFIRAALLGRLPRLGPRIG